MKVDLRFFSTYKDLVGKDRLSLSLPPGATLESLMRELVERFPRLKGYRDVVILAVNRDFADSGTKLKDGDEVALMPPVGGG